jgi:hypothetical protein
MNYQIRITTVLILLAATALFAGSSDLQNSTVSSEKLRIMPVPKDHRNYFFLQSIENQTLIVIGNFTATERVISLMIDKNGDHTVDKIYDYYPDKSEYRTPKRSKSQYYDDDFSKMMRRIIDGSMFVDTYSYQMKSIGALRQKIEEGSDIRKEGDGYRVIIYDPDAPRDIMSEFFFSKRLGKYNLVFRTKYYKIFNASIYPPLEYSVYCVNSNDKVVREVVESLLDMVR